VVSEFSGLSHWNDSMQLENPQKIKLNPQFRKVAEAAVGE
jgi:hypothetical protein